MITTQLKGKFRVGFLLLSSFGIISISATPSVTMFGPTNHHLNVSPPSNLVFVQVSAGRDHTIALTAEGRVHGWGYNGNSRATPPAGLDRVISIDAGVFHNLALKNDGTVAAWGFDGEGITRVPAGLHGVSAIAAGGYHSLALKNDGTVKGWGFNGQNRAHVPAALKGIIAIAAGRDHSLALRANGTVAAWGLNDVGQTDVPSDLNNVIAISAGDYHNLALKSDGTVVAWGGNSSGQSQIPKNATSIIAIAAGHLHSLALSDTGSVIGWGDNSKGQIHFPNPLMTAIGISAGGFHSAVLVGSGGGILNRPLSQTVLPSADVHFQISVMGSGPYSYQWLFNGASLEDQPPFSGTDSDTLSISSAGRDQGGLYTVRVFSGAQLIDQAQAVLSVRRLGHVKPPEFLTNGRVRLIFGDREGALLTTRDLYLYQLESSVDLINWEALESTLTVVNGLIQTETLPGNHQVFYRVIER